jgi:hypothetical protein
MRLVVLLFCLAPSLGVADGFREMNAQRRNFGLPPLLERADLTARAQAKAEWQAAHDISLFNRYNGHEGLITPPGMIEGTGCCDPSWGWATCVMRTLGQWPAGAGVAIGANGRRYMCLIIDTNYRNPPQTNVQRSVINTSPMTPDAPNIPRCPNHRPPAHPQYTEYEPHPYYQQLTRKYDAN